MAQTLRCLQAHTRFSGSTCEKGQVDRPTPILLGELAFRRDDREVGGLPSWHARQTYLHSRYEKTPIFYSATPDDRTAVISDGIALLVAVGFGAVHFIGWSSLLSYQELLLWRLSSISMASIPLSVIAGATILHIFKPRIRRGKRWISNLIGVDIRNTLNCLLFWVVVLLGMLYIAWRVSTLVLALTTLQLLPAGVYQAVPWTNFLPHI